MNRILSHKLLPSLPQSKPPAQCQFRLNLSPSSKQSLNQPQLHHLRRPLSRCKLMRAQDTCGVMVNGTLIKMELISTTTRKDKSSTTKVKSMVTKVETSMVRPMRRSSSPRIAAKVPTVDRAIDCLWVEDHRLVHWGGPQCHLVAQSEETPSLSKAHRCLQVPVQ